MPVIIEANYQKRLGLPGYSSHSYSVTIRTEVTDLSQVERESAKLYVLLQGAVDRKIQEVGFVPGPTNGHGSTTPRTTNGRATSPTSIQDQWTCSEKQRDLILKIVEDNKLDKKEIEPLSKQMFNAPVKALNKMETSGLIEELLQKYGKSNGSNGTGNGRRQYQRGAPR